MLTSIATVLMLAVSIPLLLVLLGLHTGVLKPNDPPHEPWAPLDEHGNRVEGGGGEED